MLVCATLWRAALWPDTARPAPHLHKVTHPFWKVDAAIGDYWLGEIWADDIPRRSAVEGVRFGRVAGAARMAAPATLGWMIFAKRWQRSRARTGRTGGSGRICKR